MYIYQCFTEIAHFALLIPDTSSLSSALGIVHICCTWHLVKQSYCRILYPLQLAPYESTAVVQCVSTAPDTLLKGLSGEILHGSKVVLIDRYSLKDISQTLILPFILSPLVNEHKTVKCYIIQIASHHLIIFKRWDTFLVAAFEAG